MTYNAKSFPHLVSGQSFSDKLLQQHVALYQNRVERLNGAIEEMEEITAHGLWGSAEFTKAKHCVSQEFDDIRLHELYFQNLGKAGNPTKNGSLLSSLRQHFGSFERWCKDFTATASLLGGGWAVLYHDNRTGNLNNLWVEDGATQNLGDGKALLVLDAWDHAYMLDYGLNRRDYIEAFLENINWQVVEDRLQVL